MQTTDGFAAMIRMLNQTTRRTLAVLTTSALALTSLSTHAADAGLRMIQVPYHDTQIDVAIWYPSTTAARPMAGGPFVPTVAHNAEPVPGKRPLVLISHGTGGMMLNHYPLATALARAGFVVASLTHPGDNYLDRSMIADPRYFHERPRQVSRMLDALLADPRWAALIDAKRIGIIGHSAGGYTAAALVGGIPDRARLVAHCRTTTDDPACRYRDPNHGIAPGANNRGALKLPDSVRAAGPVADARIHAAMLLAPLGVPIASGSLTQSTARIRIIGAEHDEVLARAYHFEHLAQGLPADAARLAPGAGHFSFLAPIEPAFQAGLAEISADPRGFDRRAFQARLAAEQVDWFRGALGQPPAVPATAPDAQQRAAPNPARTEATTPAAIATLELLFENVPSNVGLLMVAIYDNEADFRERPVRALQVPAAAGTVSLSVPGLPLGEYAVMVYQDLNGDGKLGRNLLGIPNEPWGGSLGDKTLFGAPSWDDTRLTLPAAGASVRIGLRH